VPTVPLHLELPADEVESLQIFARAHGLTTAEVVSRLARSLKATQHVGGFSRIHPEVIAITGLVPQDWSEVESGHQRYLLEKHQ